MQAFLKNYTSEVPVSQTIFRIEQVLIRCGVSGITKEYGTTAGEVVALRFHLPMAGRECTIRLPVDTDGALDALWANYVGDDKSNLASDGNSFRLGQKQKRKKDFVEQAQRTAWRLAQDWLEVELSRVQLRQGGTAEIFLAYIWDGKETFYQRLKTNDFRALLPETAGVST